LSKGCSPCSACSIAVSLMDSLILLSCW
jgi:hypothetical protein